MTTTLTSSPIWKKMLIVVVLLALDKCQIARSVAEDVHGNDGWVSGHEKWQMLP